MTAVQQQPASDPAGPTGRLATWVADLTLDDIPQAVVERAQFTSARLDADDIWSLIAATTVHLDESLAIAEITEKFRTDITVTTRDGSVHHARIDQPHGAPTDPVTNAELITKFHALADRVTSRGRADAIKRAVVGLDNLDDTNYLIDLLAAPVAGALD